MRVLICEDEEIMLTALEFRLRKSGFDVIRAENGKIAIDKIKTHQPDLIIADLIMPVVTGMELIDYVRNDLKSKIPIIVISALDLDEVILEARKLGANDFITKPFKPSELVIRVRLLAEKG